MNLLTPESIPSLSALSSASDDPGDVKRALFQTPESSSKEKNSSYAHAEGDETESVESDIISDASTSVNIDSPLHWPHNSQNLLHFPTCQGALIVSPQELASGVFRMFRMERNSDKDLSDETLSPSSTAADSGIEPSNADDFEAERFRSADFVEEESDKMAGINAEPDAVTEVTSNVDHTVISWDRRIESLERECATLKDIIRSDSARILQLRAELEAARGSGQEGSFPKQRALELLKRERVALLARESQYLEIIAKLRAKVRELEKMQNNDLDMSNEIEQLRLQNELLAHQIVANEADLDALSSENTELKEQLIVKQATTADHQRTVEEVSSRDKLHYQMSALLVKIEEIENERQRKDKVIEEDNRQIHEELATIESIIHQQRSPHQSEDHLYNDEMGTKVEVCGFDDVEVTLEGQIITTNSMPDDKENHPSVPNMKALADDDDDDFCGCLQSLSLSGED